MAAPREKLATSRAQLQELQKGGRRVFQSKELTRVHRERLLANGFIREVMKGWLISSGPSAAEGDTTPWYASFWEFCTRYCRQRFGDEWHLSPEQSLLLHAENTAIPHQVIVYTPKGTSQIPPGPDQGSKLSFIMRRRYESKLEPASSHVDKWPACLEGRNRSFGW